jgi:hypothetical protein
MIIDCEYDPDDLIDEIGDRFFSIELDENLTEREKCSQHAFIIDCENGVKIEISSDYGKSDNYKIAEALLRLLNQKYESIPKGRQ